MVELTDSAAGDSAEFARFLAVAEPGFFDYEYRRYDPAHSVFIQARDDGELIGTQALIPHPLVISGQRILTGRSERTKVSANTRGGGLFPRMMEACATAGTQKGLQFIWGTTILKKAFQRVGFLFFNRFYEHALLCLDTSKAVSDIRATTDKRLRAAKLAAAAPSAVLRSASRMAPAESLQIEARPHDYQDVFQLYEDLRGKDPLIVMDQDERFLHWLLDEGNRTILRIYGYRGAKLAGYIFVDVSDPSMARIVDFAARDARALRSLLRVVFARVREHGAAFVEATYNARNPLQRRMRRTLLLSGFVPVHRGGGFVVRPLAFNDLNYLNDISRWYITGTWVQLFRGS